MLQLPNGCFCSEPSIFPKNWDKAGASTKSEWYIQYYFYDPNFKTKYKNGSLRIVKGGINRFKTLTERRECVKILLNELLIILQQDGYNPITKKQIAPLIIDYEIDPSTPFMQALQKVFVKLKLANSTKADLKSMLVYVGKSSSELRMTNICISDVKRRHIKIILDKVAEIKEYSAHRYNKYRSYLMILFSELVEMEAIESNPVKDIKIHKTTKKLRTLLSTDERQKIDTFLKQKYYTFWRFLQIFFHSGGRINELLNVKVKDVDLNKQSYLAVINKGKQSHEVMRTIKDNVLPLWIELLKNMDNEIYIFSNGLNPGLKSIRREQITRRWKVHVKASVENGGLGIIADFYSLKHLNLDETAAQLDLNAAAAMAGHTTPAVTLRYYAQGEKERQHERLKKVSNTFSNK